MSTSNRFNLKNRIQEKSTAFLLDEFVTTTLRIYHAEPASVALAEYQKRAQALWSALVDRLTDEETLGDSHPVMLTLDLVDTLVKCWFAQEIIMDESLSEKQRLEGAIDAQHQNARRSNLIRRLDLVLGELDRTVPNKTYSYFTDEEK